MSVKRVVIVMAKRPEAGQTKTRLTSELSPEGAAALYECFVLDTIDRLLARTDCEVAIAVPDRAAADYFAGQYRHVQQIEQLGNGLGDRLASVMTEGLRRDYAEVVALGSDSPDLPDARFDEAFAELGNPDIDIVFGPADDGGYYLIGWKQPWPRVVRGVTMSTSSVLADTLAIVSEEGARHALIERWYDVDEPSDLNRLRGSASLHLAPRTAAVLQHTSTS